LLLKAARFSRQLVLSSIGLRWVVKEGSQRKLEGRIPAKHAVEGRGSGPSGTLAQGIPVFLISTGMHNGQKTSHDFIEKKTSRSRAREKPSQPLGRFRGFVTS